MLLGARRGCPELFPSGQSLLAPVLEETPLCLPSSGARSRSLFGVVGAEEVFVFAVAACLFGSYVCFLSEFFARLSLNKPPICIGFRARSTGVSANVVPQQIAGQSPH
ncbi:hypothetical protein BRADI_4g07933v3 [Brachypodium distachyon]|uniref:Transmembrane protein n=1 Tax=Brachypodium distachyon TaxID=15368 RepID=A0A2K2CL62_BRADI|nr:hypothetical protein BRADI_4g07933v3 [Brachypodium distachyon]